MVFGGEGGGRTCARSIIILVMQSRLFPVAALFYSGTGLYVLCCLFVVARQRWANRAKTRTGGRAGGRTLTPSLRTRAATTVLFAACFWYCCRALLAALAVFAAGDAPRVGALLLNAWCYVLLLITVFFYQAGTIIVFSFACLSFLLFSEGDNSSMLVLCTHTCP